MNRTPVLRRPCIQGVSLGVFCLFASMAISAQSPVFQNTLLPEPSRITAAGGSIPFTKDFTVSLSGAHSAILEEATRRTLDSMEAYTGVQLNKAPQDATATLTIQVQDTTGTRPTLDTDESYSIDSTSNKLVLQAKTVLDRRAHV